MLIRRACSCDNRRVSAKDELASNRAEVDSWREDIEGSGMLVSFFLVPAFVALPAILILGPFLEPYLGPAGDWLKEGSHWLGKTIATVMIILMVIGIIAVPGWLIPLWMEKWWKRNYDLAQRMLEEHDLALLLLSEAFTERIFDYLNRSRWQKISATRRPQTLVQKIEFASDYWRALYWIARERERGLGRQVAWGNFVRLLDDIAPLVFNGCAGILVMAFSGPFVIFVAPLWVLLIGWSTQQQAVQAALLDFFSEDSA